MTRMSTRTHGLLDLVTAGTLAAVPRLLGCGERLTDTLTTAAVGTLGYSLMTNYEFGLVRVLPMRAHLALDAIAGAALCAAPALFPEEDPTTRAALVGLGLSEIGAALLTSPEPFAARDRDLTGPSGSAEAGYRPGVRASSTSGML